jgi:hypothetical protein
MAQPHNSDRPDDGLNWIDQARQRGLGGALGLALDVLQPLGPLAAQLLWVAQPAASLFGWRQTVGGLARALEEPGGLDQLRQRLHSDSTGAAIEDDKSAG